MSKTTMTPEQRQNLLNFNAAMPFLVISLVAAVYFTHWHANYAIALVCASAAAYLAPVEVGISTRKRIQRFFFITLEMLAAIAASLSFAVPAFSHWFGLSVIGYFAICFASSLISLATEHDSRWMRTLTAVLYLVVMLVVFSGNYHSAVIFETWFCVGSVGIATLLLPLALHVMKKEDEEALHSNP